MFCANAILQKLKEESLKISGVFPCWVMILILNENVVVRA